MKPAFYIVNDFAMMVGGAVIDAAVSAAIHAARYARKCGWIDD